jgi:hypothetical protein
MEEDEYKSTYAAIAEVRCVFEKALTNHQAKCSCSRHFWLADREGYACKHAADASICTQLLQILRENSRFSLKLKTVGSALAHNMDIRVQAGGLQGLQHVVAGEPGSISDIRGLIKRALLRFGDLKDLPYTRIIQSVASFQGRKRRSKSTPE